MTVILIAIWFASAAWLGSALAGRALHGENRQAVLVSYGVLAGHVVQAVLLVLIWGAVPLGVGFWIVVALSCLCGAAIRVWFRGSQPPDCITWGFSRTNTLITLLLLAAFAIIGHRVFTIGYTTLDAEILFFHSAVTERMTLEQYPPTNPLEPDDPLRYRFGYHTLAAAIRSQSAEMAPIVLANLTAAILPLMLLALLGASVRSTGFAKPGVIAALLALFGGSLVLVWEFLKAVLLGMPFATPLNPRLIFGIVWHGNTLDMVRISPTVAIGFVAFVIALWLCSEALDGQGSWSAFVIGACSLSYVGLVNEVSFSLLAGGLIATTALALLRRSGNGAGLLRPKEHWKSVASCLLLVTISYLIVSFRGGLSGGISFFASGVNSLQMGLNLDRLGQVPRPPYSPEEAWIPLFSAETAFDTVFLLAGLPALLVLALKNRSSLAQRALLAGLAGLILWVTTYSYRRPADSYRLGQAALTIYLCMLPITVAPIWKSILRRFGLLANRWRVAVALLTAPHIALSMIMLLAQPDPLLVQLDGVDVQAAKYLRDFTPPKRVLIPLEDPDRGDVADLYGPSGPGSAARQILAISGQAIPMGHSTFFSKEAYLPLYHQASRSFTSQDLSALKIDWVYLLPSSLDEEQRQNLFLARASGTLALERTLGEPGTRSERLLLRVTPKN